LQLNSIEVGRWWKGGRAIAERDSVLEQLTFSIEKDSEVTSPKLKKYLKIYSIDFASQYDASHRMGIVSAQGFKIATHYWHFEDARATVFILHDLFDHVGLYGHVIQWCLKEHYNVVAFDFPGHGLSTGAKASIDNIDQYGAVLETVIARCNKNLRSPYLCIAQGAGAAMVMNMMWTRGKRPFSKIALLAPLVRLRESPLAKFKYFLGGLLGKTVRRRFVANTGDKAFMRFIRRKDSLQSKRTPVKLIAATKQWAADFPSRPIEVINPLVIQGHRDTTMDWKYNMKEVKTHFPNATVKYVPSGNHNLVNEVEGLRKGVLREIKKYFDPPAIKW
jgi:alpha-beta hydrolase superfamily lysophospholipase